VVDKVFVKSFAKDFAGIDAEGSAIGPDSNAVARAVNHEWALSDNLRGRVGSQLIGPRSKVIFSHNYNRTVNGYAEVFTAGSPSINGVKSNADGATVLQQLAVVGSDLVRQQLYNVSFTRVAGSTTISYYMTVGSGGTIHFILKQGGATYLDYDCGDLTTSPIKTYYSLLQAIDATANFSVTFTRANCPPYALINGNQDPVSGGSLLDGAAIHQQMSLWTITVTAGHTFLPCDTIILPVNNPAGYESFTYGYVISKTGTTITFAASFDFPGFTTGTPLFSNARVLGALGTPAQFLPIDTEISSSTIAFPYYKSCGLFLGPLSLSAPTSQSSYTLPNGVSLNGVFYFAAKATVAATPLTLMKYDGQMVTSAGLPATFSSSIPLGVGPLTGTYRYRVFFRRIDSQGNIIEGPVSDAETQSPVANNVVMALFTGTLNYRNSYVSGWSYVVDSAYSAQQRLAFTGGATTLQVDNANGNVGYLQVGDPICFNDAAGVFHRSMVTSVDGSVSPQTITMESGSYGDVSNNTPISGGNSIVILRTTDGGTIYYELTEIAIDAFQNSQSYTDSTLDSALIQKAIFTPPDTGYEHDPVTDCSLVCEHQGGLVVAGGIANPNTGSFSSSDGPEYFPLASNNFDIPATRQGAITAIASDTIDRLAVFKADSYYDVAGDLTSGQIAINLVNEGDYGITCQNSLARVKGKLVGLSKLGFVTISNGVLFDQDFRKVNARLVNQNYSFNLAAGCNDPFNRNYICAIPESSSSTHTIVLDYSRPGVTPFERDYNANLVPNGFCMYGDALYSNTPNGITRRLRRFASNSPTGDDADSYIDHTYAIPYILELNCLNLDEPSLFKNLVRIRLFSIPNDYIVEGWVDFATFVELSRLPDPSFLGNAATGGGSTTLTFATINDWYLEWKPPSARTPFVLLRFTTNTIRQAPFISGYELVISAAYQKEDIRK
jgi:hypothetical protein